jgi:hypothetical protein
MLVRSAKNTDEQSSDLSCLSNKRILLITEVAFGSGDFFAAKKLIRQLEKSCPSIKIDWLIRSPKNRKDVASKVEDARKTFGENISVSQLDTNAKLDIGLYDTSNLVLMFPTVHYLQPYDFEKLKSIGVPMLQVHEYDAIPLLHHLANKDELASVNTGFDGLGLFLEDMQSHDLTLKQDALQLGNTKLDLNREIFFSYLNLDEASVSNEANFSNFAHIAIDVADPEKSIDIIANSPFSFLDKAFISDAWNHGFSEIVFIKKAKDGAVEEHRIQSPRKSEDNKQLRIIDPFPLSHQQMLALMAHAHPFQQITGDQSLSEVMSLPTVEKGVFPFYQMMDWKSGLHKNWSKLAASYLGKDSPYVQLLELTARKKKLDTDGFSSIWHENKVRILDDSKLLFQKISAEKNLTSNFPVYLNNLFFIINEIAPEFFANFSKLLVQLVAKIEDDSGIKNLIRLLSKDENKESMLATVNAVAEFLKLNAGKFDQVSLAHIISQLQDIPRNKRIEAAKTAKQVLDIIPAHLRDQWSGKILPELQDASEDIYPRIVDMVGKIEAFEVVQQRSDWLCNIIAKEGLWVEDISDNKEHNKILLAVSVWDGVGDIAKFIGTYKQLEKSFPGTEIVSLIKCMDSGRPALLAMLRENGIPLGNVSVISLSPIEFMLMEAGASENKSVRGKLAHANFGYSRDYSLIISVATPFREINSIVREYVGTIPYIEIGEVNFCSYQSNLDLLTPRDAQHTVVAMGLSEDSVGMEITTLPEEGVEKLFSYLSPALARKLLDGESNPTSLSKFQRESFFMPAYVKDDEGVLSLHYMLSLMRNYYKEKQTGVMWVYKLPLDITSQAFQDHLKQAGVSTVVIYDDKGQRSESRVDGVEGDKILRIVCGKVEKEEFDILYKIASNSGGFAGCVGQNSFEKALSFDLIPAFYAPPWQLAIIYQCQGMLAKVFAFDSREYRCISEYLNLLSDISLYIQESSRLFSHPEFKVHKERLLQLSRNEYMVEIRKIADDVNPLLREYFPNAFEKHPVDRLNDFLSKHDKQILQSAWKSVCDYIKENKNLNTWVVDAAERYLPVNARNAAKKSDNSSEKVSSYISTFHYEDVAINESLGQTNDYLREVLRDVWPRHIQEGLHLYLTDSDSYLVAMVAGSVRPTLAISAEVIRILSEGELRFALRLYAEIYKKYPVENPKIRMRDISQQEILAAIPSDLEYAISYSRKLIKVIRDKQALLHDKRISKGETSTGECHEWYELYYESEFYEGLIKNIELILSKKFKHTLNHQLFVAKESPLPRNVQGEAELFESECRSRVDQDHRIFATNEVLQGMLGEIPSMRMMSLYEYVYPTAQTREFLGKLNHLVVDKSDPCVVAGLKELVKAAFENKLACFTDVYQIVSSKLAHHGNLLIMAPFTELERCVAEFMSVKTPEDALIAAKSIEDFLNDDKHASLFKNNHDPSYWRNNENKKLKDDECPLSSNIGLKINWDEVINLPNKYMTRHQELVKLAEQDRSGVVAKVLFRLGMIGEPRIWKCLPENFVKSVINVDSILIGSIPQQYQRGYSCDVKPVIGENFINDYMRHRYGMVGPSIINLPLTRENIESYVEQYLDALAFPDINQQQANLLMVALEKYVAQNPEDGKNLVRQFYCDEAYPYGLYALRKRLKNVAVFRDQFEMAIDGDNRNDKKYTISNSTKWPYLNFLLRNTPDYLSLVDLFSSFHENVGMVYSHWPVEYIFKVMDIKVDCLSSAAVAAEKLTSAKQSMSAYGGDSYFSSSIDNAFSYAAEQAESVQLFAEETYQFMLDAERFHAASRNLYAILWSRPEFSRQLNNKNITASLSNIVGLYKKLDSMVTWPDMATRNKFSKIVLRALKRSDREERLKALEELLFGSIALTDMQLIQKLIKMWVHVQAEKLGKDDNTYQYYLLISKLSSRVVRGVPTLYAKDMLQGLAVAVDAQERSTLYMDSELNPTAEVGESIVNKEDLLIKMAKKLSEADASLNVVQFLTHELTNSSLDKFVSAMKGDARRALGQEYFGYEAMDNEKTSMLSIGLYHMFWSRSIEERAVVINNLLMPSSKTASVESANAAYKFAFQFISDLLFPDKNEENNMGKALLRSYLDSGNPHVRPYLLAAVITANKMLEGKKKNIATTLPKLAEAMGAAGVKAGQAAHSYPNTPADIREGLAFLKSQARLPTRWDLWKLIRSAVPEELLDIINKVKKLIGGASFYLAIEVEMKDGKTAVLRLLRENAEEEANYGFAHLKATLENCEDGSIQKISKDLSHIITQAENGAKIEIDHQSVAQQYQIANTIYKDKFYDIEINNNQYHIQIKPVDLYSFGPGYQLISMAEGVEFNDMKVNPGNVELCQAVALAVCKTELVAMLGDGPSDCDRHGAQARILCKEIAPNEFNVIVTNYDFGEISPILPTRAELERCHEFIDTVKDELFSPWNLVKSATSLGSNSSMMSQLTGRLLDYMREHSREGSADDMTRLNGIFKGLLALSDYFEVLAKDKSLLLELKDVFVEPTAMPSIVSGLLGLFSGRRHAHMSEVKPSFNSANSMN